MAHVGTQVHMPSFFSQEDDPELLHYHRKKRGGAFVLAGLGESRGVRWAMKKKLVWLFDIGDYTTQLYGDYNKPL